MRCGTRRGAPPTFVLLLLATAWLLVALPVDLRASEVFDSNPFDPGRKPLNQGQKKENYAPLPELTARDLQIEAIIAFGQFRGIIAQLDGRLKNSLPTNAAGRVRIQVGQSFGGGYVLAGLDTHQVIVQGGNQQFAIPLLRKVSKTSSPSPATVPPEQPPVLPPSQSAAVAVEPPPPQVAPALPASGNPFAGLPPPPQPEPSPPKPLPPAEATPPVQAAQTQPGQPMSLLDAIKKAEEAAAAKSRSNPVQPGTPFTGKQ